MKCIGCGKHFICSMDCKPEMDVCFCPKCALLKLKRELAILSILSKRNIEGYKQMQYKVLITCYKEIAKNLVAAEL